MIKKDRYTEIMEGTLTFPEQIMTLLNPLKDEALTALIEGFWSNLWHNFLREKPSNTLVWFNKFNNPKLFNTMLMHLSKSGWITSDVSANYAWISLNASKLRQWVSDEQLREVRFTYKSNKYRMKKVKSVLDNVVQLNGKHTQTGLVREGFKKAGNTVFWYDVEYIGRYAEGIAHNIKKGLKASTKDVTYQEIIDELLYYYAKADQDYTLGNCIIDSRGRSIFQCTKKIFNPISHKDARAMLMCEPEELTEEGFRSVYAAIAELLGYRGKNIQDKVNYGIEAFVNRVIPSYTEMEMNEDYSDLHVLIWLERIYENLATYPDTKEWYVAIDYDALGSLIQLVAVLTNDYEYMKRTNMIKGEEFQDIWTVPYCSREHIKTVLTPKLYGSGKEPKELWDKNKLEYTQIQLNKITADIRTGIYANANNFKDFVISKVKPEKTMKVKVWGEEFTIECNRFKWEETVQVPYQVYTSSQGLMKKVTLNTHLVPDTEQFKRFFQTLILHSLDSRIANEVCKIVPNVLPNHDSFICHPNAGYAVREVYTDCMYRIYQERKTILKDYFTSIGIEEEYPEVTHNHDIKEFSPYCLK